MAEKCTNIENQKGSSNSKSIILNPHLWSLKRQRKVTRKKHHSNHLLNLHREDDAATDLGKKVKLF